MRPAGITCGLGSVEMQCMWEAFPWLSLASHRCWVPVAVTEHLLCVQLRLGLLVLLTTLGVLGGVSSLVSLRRKLTLSGGSLVGYLGDGMFEWGGAWQCPWQGSLVLIV